jgi:hypothetical protein
MKQFEEIFLKKMLKMSQKSSKRKFKTKAFSYKKSLTKYQRSSGSREIEFKNL